MHVALRVVPVPAGGQQLPVLVVLAVVVDVPPREGLEGWHQQHPRVVVVHLAALDPLAPRGQHHGGAPPQGAAGPGHDAALGVGGRLRPALGYARRAALPEEPGHGEQAKEPAHGAGPQEEGLGGGARADGGAHALVLAAGVGPGGVVRFVVVPSLHRDGWGHGAAAVAAVLLVLCGWVEGKGGGGWLLESVRSDQGMGLHLHLHRHRHRHLNASQENYIKNQPLPTSGFSVDDAPCPLPLAPIAPPSPHRDGEGSPPLGIGPCWPPALQDISISCAEALEPRGVLPPRPRKVRPGELTLSPPALPLRGLR